MSLPNNTPDFIKSQEGPLKLLTAVALGVVVAGGDKKESHINVVEELKKKLATANPAEAVVISSEIRLLEAKLGIIEEVPHVQKNQAVHNESSSSSNVALPVDSVIVQSEPSGRAIPADANTINELKELVSFYEQSKN
jgi:hypothetical protein